MHQSSMHAMSCFVQDHLRDHRGRPLRVLDVGSMDVNGSYRTLIDDPSWEYTGLDVEPGDGVDVVLPSPYDWSAVADASYDVVISGQAFEHIEFPWVTILSVARVLKPGGLLCIVVPSSGFEHRYPVDCWRYYPDGVAALARWADLDVLSATTDWTGEGGFTDGSEAWRDTVLVARKPTERARHSLKARIKRSVLRRVGELQSARTQSIR